MFLAKFLLSLILSVIIVRDFLYANVGIIKKFSGSSAGKRLRHYVLLIKGHNAVIIFILSFVFLHMQSSIFLCVMGSVFIYIIKFIIEINTVIKLAHK